MIYTTIKCRQCGSSFVWSGEEQELYKKRGLSAPEYCPICRGMMEAKSRDRNRARYNKSSIN